MRKIKHKTHIAFNLPTLYLEGNLLLPDQLEKAALGQAIRQQEADYQTPKGLKLKDDYSRAFQIACAQWKHFSALLERSDTNALQITTTFVHEFLRDALGYHDLQAVKSIELAERQYPLTFMAAAVPVLVAPHHLGLDDLDTSFAIGGSGSRRKSAFQLAQEFLNASPDSLWAIVSNGRQLRLLRDANTLTRPSYLEFDLEDMLGGQRFAEFAMTWRLLHASRAGQPGEPPQSCIWEAWRSAGQEEGTRVREGLRNGVTQALLTLGNGFLQHNSNEALRRALQTGELSKEQYFQQLLRLVYRLIFLFTVEERGLLHPADDSSTTKAARRLYATGYALSHLRELSLRRRAKNHFADIWTGVRIVFRGLAAGEPKLALPALGGLFAAQQCPMLDVASLSNEALLETIKHLRWDNSSGTLAPVDYRNMGPEELGSVYESLLELVPEIELPLRKFGFAGLTSEGSTQGNARKTSGSYYTPDSLVQELIKSALDPVIAQRIAASPANPIEALLSIKVVDPACGSGHFLLAAARRLAERVAALRTLEGAVKPQDYRHALREVIGRCIFGVDRNPMALELCRMALWLEGFEEGLPLSFLDHHLQCGDALLGLTDLKALQYGIPAAAFKPLSGDDVAVCRELAKVNKLGLKAMEQQRTGQQTSLALESAAGLSALQSLETLPDATPADIAARETAWQQFVQQAQDSRLAHAADLLLGAFLLKKADDMVSNIPTSQTLFLELFSDQQGLQGVRSQQHQEQLRAACAACSEARVLHWPLAFPQVFKQGGFDCVLGNPPWEHVELKEEEFFASRNRLVAEAKNKAERSQRIDWLSNGVLVKHLYPNLEYSDVTSVDEKKLFRAFVVAKRILEAVSCFAHVKSDEGGRYPLTGIGRVNTYALFAETISQVVAAKGRAGFIVPIGIATDDSTKEFFSMMTTSGRLVELFAFENEEFIFQGVHHSFRFCLLVLGGQAQSEEANFLFFARKPSQIYDVRRRFKLSADDFALINPNTLTCPVFRSGRDAELTREIYQRVPVLIREGRAGMAEQNPWGISFMQGTHNMASDSGLFKSAGGEGFLPLYEAKMIHQFDHRWASYQIEKDEAVASDVSLADKQNLDFTITPRYWVDEAQVRQQLEDKGWMKQWLLGWRDITSAHVLRTVIASVVPVAAVGHTMPIIVSNKPTALIASLLANLSSIILDYIARVKVGGMHLTYSYLKQFPVLPPDFYSVSDLTFIVPRVVELTYTAVDMQPWAEDLGYIGKPFIFDPGRRAILRAELDAWYARAYGLNRDELRYILDPAETEGSDYPSETFRVLKNSELKEFGVYRTQQLVLREFDRMALAAASGEEFSSLLQPPPGVPLQPSYSPHGIIRDDEDARLAALIVIMIQQAVRLPRQRLVDALTLVSQPVLLSTFLNSQSCAKVVDYHQRNSSIFAASRLANGRLQSWLRHLESVGLVRVEMTADLLVGIPDVALPTYLLVDAETDQIANLLLQAAEKAVTSTAINQTEVVGDTIKRA